MSETDRMSFIIFSLYFVFVAIHLIKKLDYGTKKSKVCTSEIE